MLVLQLLIFLISVHLSLSCNGIKILERSFRSCGGNGDQVIKHLNGTVDLNEKCEVNSNTCSEVKP
ncbi:CLUMA_CG013828, isoform A [Clunio marinus]|nr:CLUMA_CG013828, isoform A [Clunio marinus]